MKKRAILTAVSTFLIFVFTQIAFSSIGLIIQGGVISSYFLLFPIAGDVLSLTLVLLYLSRKKELQCLFRTFIVPAKQWIIPLIAIILYSVAGNLILHTISFSENMQGNMEIMESSIKINPFLYCVAVYLVAPITEEFIFRGFIQTRLCRSMNAVPAILISSVLFAATHFMTGSISTVLFTFFGGILFGLTYKKTGCLLLTIIVHIVGNLSEILAAVLIPVMG